MIVPKDLFFLQEKVDVIQIILLDSLKDKKDIKIIIEISQNLENALNFILNNYTKIIEKFNSFSYFKTHYKIDLNNIEINNNTNIINIGSLLKKIIKLGEDNYYRLINYDELFMNLVDKLYDFDITKYYQLYNIANIMKMKGDNLEIFFEKVHTKGINLIKDKKMKIEKIIAFIQLNQYYCNPHFKEKGKNDPVIMEYIQITDVDPNYLKNMELIKKNNLIDIFIK